MTDGESGPDPNNDGDDDEGAEVDGGAVVSGEPLATTADTDAESASGLDHWLDQVSGVAAREYRPAIRSRWTLGIALLFAVFTTALVQFGASRVGPGRFDAVVASIAELGVYIIPLVALAFGYDAIVGAHERGSLELLLSLPISRRRVVVGKFLGRAVALGGAMLVGFLPGAVLTLLYVGARGIGTYAFVTLAAVLTGLAFLSLALLISTVAREKAHALGIALAAWLWFVLLHDLAALTAVGALDLPSGTLAAIVLANPTDCYRVLVLSTVDVTAGGFGAIMTQASLSVGLVGAGLVAWIAVPLWLASGQLGRRRL